MNEREALLEQAEELLRRAASLPWEPENDATVIRSTRAVESIGRCIDGMRVLAAAEIDDRSRHELGTDSLSFRHSHPRPVHFLEALTHVSQREAQRRITIGREVRDRSTLYGLELPPEQPQVASAFLGGDIGIDSADVVLGCIRQINRAHADFEDIAKATNILLDEARAVSADRLAITARVLRDRIDADGAEPRDDEAHRQRSLWIGRSRNGLVPFGGQAMPKLAALLQNVMDEACDPAATPRFLSDDEMENGKETLLADDGTEIIVLTDPRSRQQKQHDILEGVLVAGVRASHDAPVDMRSTAKVVSLVLDSDLRAHTGAGWIDGIDESVPMSTIEEMICEGGLQEVIVGDTPDDLRLGRTRRTFSPKQLMVLALLFGGCIINGCDAPPERTQGHHVDEWVEDVGPTNVENGVLLCGQHHRWLHRSRYRMRMIDGRPHLLAPYDIDPEQKWMVQGMSRAMIALAMKHTLAA